MADPTLPDLSQYNLSVTPFEGLIPIATQFGLGNTFGGADYIAAREAGYNDAEIIAFLKAYPYLDQNNISGRLAAGQGPSIIQAATANLAGSDPRRAAAVNPNPPSTAIPDAQYGIPGRGNDPSVQMYNANVDVRGNDTYTQLMQASQLGTLVIAKDPPQNTFFGMFQPNTYKLIDSATGNIIVDGVSPGQQKGTYQFTFGNPQSEGSVTAVIAANPDTGQVGTINPKTQMTYQSGLGGGMLGGFISGIEQLAPIALAFAGGGGLGLQIASSLGITDAVAATMGVDLATATAAEVASVNSIAAQVGSGILSTATQVATGTPIQTAIQNTAVSQIIQGGSNQAAQILGNYAGNPTITNAINSAAASAAKTAAFGGDTSSVITSSLLGAGLGAANTPQSQQGQTPATPVPTTTPAAPTTVAAADTGTQTDISGGTTGTIPQPNVNLANPPGIPAGAINYQSSLGEIFVDPATGIAYDAAGNIIKEDLLIVDKPLGKVSVPQDFLSKYGALFSFGTNDPNAPRMSILGSGASGGTDKGGFVLFAFDNPQQQQDTITYLTNTVIPQINADPNATPAEKALANDLLAQANAVTPTQAAQPSEAPQPAEAPQPQPQQGQDQAQPSAQPSGQPSEAPASSPESAPSNAGAAAQQPNIVSVTPGSSLSQALGTNLPVISTGGTPINQQPGEATGTPSAPVSSGAPGAPISSGGAFGPLAPVEPTGTGGAGQGGTGQGGPGSVGPGTQGTGSGVSGTATAGTGFQGTTGYGPSGPGGPGTGGIGPGGTGTGGTGTGTGTTADSSTVQSPTIFSVGRQQTLAPVQQSGTQAGASSAALAQALNLGNLGDPFFTSTGKKPRYVWNQASLRTGNETGVQSG
jgi:hypothetical protein